MILILGELVSLIVFKILNFSNLKDYFNNEFEDDEDLYDDPFDATEKVSKATPMLNQNGHKLSDRHQYLLKEAYLHPYEKFHKVEKAKQQLDHLVQK